MTNSTSHSPSSPSLKDLVQRMFGRSEPANLAALESLTRIDALPVDLPASISDADPVAAFQESLIAQNKLDRQVIEIQRSSEERRREILRSMLDIADGLDRIVRFAQAHDEFKSPEGTKLLEGLESVKRVTQRNLGKAGVKRIDTLGVIPDTEFCEIHSERTVPGAQPGIVVDELLPGYTIDGKLLRAASVVVAAD